MTPRAATSVTSGLNGFSGAVLNGRGNGPHAAIVNAASTRTHWPILWPILQNRQFLKKSRITGPWHYIRTHETMSPRIRAAVRIKIWGIIADPWYYSLRTIAARPRP